MKTRKIIAVILLLVLSAQLVPLKQTMAWLLGGTATEELAHTNGPSPTRTGEEWQKDFLPGALPILEHYSHIPTVPLHSIHSAALPLRHADDIPTPPPNC
ncbi:hypothetical protein [Puia sp.]|uniref:hypothetical protein n=1 Tax=Puia sp. TaxID=2045100 RepID=UPI002F3FBE77